MDNKKQDGFEEQLYKLFIPLTKKISFRKLEEKLEQSDSIEDIDLYLSKYLFYAIFISLLLGLFGIMGIIVTKNIHYLGYLFLICFSIFIIVILYSILKPFLDVMSKVTTIENNLPLAILSMSSIAESGAPPEAMFKIKTLKAEQKEISAELSKITYYIDNLGISLLEAISLVANKTPSLELKKFLIELKSNIESGGSLSHYMAKKAEHAQFTYNLMLDKLNRKSETFGDIYSAIVVAGPLFLFSTIMLLGMMGSGGIGGLDIDVLMLLGVFVLVPLVNIMFLIILQFSE